MMGASTTAADIEMFVDFLDSVFGRKRFPKQETWINGYTFAEWRRTTGESIDPQRHRPHAPGDFNRRTWNEARPSIQQQIRWALGEEPTGVRFPVRGKVNQTILTSDGWMSGMYERPLKGSGMAYTPVAYGDDLKADLYYPEGSVKGTKLPVADLAASVLLRDGLLALHQTHFSYPSPNAALPCWPSIRSASDY